MNKTEIAAMFASMADIMEILGEDSFRISSYRRVARSLEDTTEDLDALAEAGRLEELPGIGKSTAAKLLELHKTGKLAVYEQLCQKVPPGLLALLRVQGMGPKTAAKVWKQADVTSLEELRHVLDSDPGRIEAIAGMGPKKVAMLKESLRFVESSAGRIGLDEACCVADVLLPAMRNCPGVIQVSAAGSFRRWRESVGDLDLVVAARPEDAESIIAAFTAIPNVTQVLAKGSTKGAVMVDGRVQADLRVVPPESFGAAMQYFTGSKAHNVALRELAVKKGWKLNEYGLYDSAGKQLAGADEEGIYAALDMQYTPPEIREDRGELDAARRSALPKLVEEADIHADFHMHTVASDGKNSIDEMIDACRRLGYRFIAITDHSKSQTVANGLDETRLLEHVKAIHAAAARHKDILVLAGAEVDIHKDGSLDYADDILAQLDFVVASPHSGLAEKGEQATAKLVAAIANPFVHVIGHPTGRLLNQRPGMEIDIVAVAKAAAKHGKALEINADPSRLDLRDVHVKATIEAGAKIIIGTDAHNVAGLGVMKYGMHTARRGWATAADVINTWPAPAFKKWLHPRGARQLAIGNRALIE